MKRFAFLVVCLYAAALIGCGTNPPSLEEQIQNSVIPTEFEQAGIVWNLQAAMTSADEEL